MSARDAGLGAAPPRLRPGDQLGVIAPSGPPAKAALADGLDALAGVFRVRVAASALAPSPPPFAPYLAADDARRADETNAMIADPDVRAIVLARGGYGLLRILPLLDAAALRADPKPIVGFSDGTALLSWALRAGVRGIHGPVAVRLGGARAEAMGELVRALTDPTPLGELPWALRGSAAPTDAASPEVIAPMVPCNLVMACHLLATPWQLPADGTAWWIEEVGERPYELDRALTQLELAGQTRRLAGVVVGELVRCMEPPPGPEERDDPSAALAVVEERLRHVEARYLVGGTFGHGRRNPPLPFGGRCRLDLAAGAAEILDGAVA
ncbi:MAG: LD-carboxypeptidase [Kofleriaceae bacterium]